MKPSVCGTHKRLQAGAHHAPALGQDPRLPSACARMRASRGLLAPSTLRNLHRSNDVGHRGCCKTRSWLLLCAPTGSDSSGPLLLNHWGGVARQMQSTREQLKCCSLTFHFPLEGFKCILRESLQRFPCAFRFSSDH